MARLHVGDTSTSTAANNLVLISIIVKNGEEKKCICAGVVVVVEELDPSRASKVNCEFIYVNSNVLKWKYNGLYM